jgi:Holliday junction resolvase RusA-like endonuclease
MTLILAIDPVPKPRMTRADKWKQRPSVMRYRAFADEWRLKVPRDYDLNGCNIQFTIGMPKSWSKKKKREMEGEPHTQTPDLDNLLKAVCDAHMGDDSGIHTLGGLSKVWGQSGSILVTEYFLPW